MKPAPPPKKNPALAKPVPKETTIERDLLLRMSNDQRFLDLFPPLKTLKQKQRQKKKNCGCGSKTKPNLVQEDFETAKRQLTNLLSGNPALQKSMKSLLGAQVLRFKYNKADKSGAVVKKFG